MFVLKELLLEERKELEEWLEHTEEKNFNVRSLVRTRIRAIDKLITMLDETKKD